MIWLQRYRLRYYVRNSVWVAPVAGMAVGLIAVRLVHGVDEALGWVSPLDPEPMRAVLGTLAGAMFTFIVFVCSSLLLVVQLASAQLSPRVIGTMLRDRVTKVTLAVFVFTFTFGLATLVRIDQHVPLLTTRVSVYSCAVSVGVFLYLIDHIAKILRPSGVLTVVAVQGHRVIDTVYPRPFSEQEHSGADFAEIRQRLPTRIVPSTWGGVVLAFNEAGLVALGARHDCIIELLPQVGDFLAPNDPLFRVHGGTAVPAAALLNSIALGFERTVEQDPMFALRVIVDIASKGLSPAINDPTTAVLALDRIHHLLRHVGKRRLDNQKVRDASGQVRLYYRTPNWEDFVLLAVTEIRQFGATSVQIARRLRFMLENLIESLPPQRTAPLELELKLLKRSTQCHFAELEDQARADTSDSQGVGGTQETYPRLQRAPGLAHDHTKTNNPSLFGEQPS